VGRSNPQSLIGCTPARLYFAIEDVLDRLRSAGTLVDAAYQALILGMLDREALTGLTQTYYARRSAKYKRLEYTRLGLRGWELASLDRYFSQCRTLLLTSAGGGRELFGLVERGFEVHACECNEELVEASAEMLEGLGVATRIALSAPDDVPDFGVHDGAIIGWGGYMHVLGRSQRVAFLRKVRGQLVIDGPLLLSFLARRKDARKDAYVAKIGNAIRRLRGKPAEVELGDAIGGYACHRFVRDELQRELLAGGFRMDLYNGDELYAVGIAV
jgi:hypothetical protein